MGFLILGHPIFYQRHVEEIFISDDCLFRHHYSISTNSSKRLQSYDRRGQCINIIRIYVAFLLRLFWFIL